MKKIVKRDGRIVAFNEDKITKAIKAAAKSVKYDGSEEEFEKLTDEAVGTAEEKYYSQGLKPTVENIQDIVEAVLVKENLYEVAKSYMLYRDERTKKRERKSNLMEKFVSITLGKESDKVLKNSNGNVSEDEPMGKMLCIGAESSKEFAHQYLLSEEASKAHLNGDIHIHDLDFYSTGTQTCVQVDLDRLFENGFNTGHGFIRPPQSIKTYSALTCIVLQAATNNQHGGIATPMFDYYLAPGVAKTFIDEFVKVLEDRYDIPEENLKEYKKQLREFYASHKRTIINDDGKAFVKELFADTDVDVDIVWDKAYKKTDKETFQAMESLVHNLNSMHSRAGSQVPFSSINLGTCTTEEGREVTKNLLLAVQKGLGNGETAIFPISIFKVKEGINYNPDDPNYDLFKLAIATSAKRLFPNYVFEDCPMNAQYLKYNKDGSIDPESETAVMGCRTRVMANNYDKDNQKCIRRGNSSFTSINLPRLGIKAKGDIDKFYKMLDDMMELVKRQLLERLKFQGSMKVKNFNFIMGEGLWYGSEKLNPEDTLEEVVKEGSLSIGFIGLAETLKALVGKHHGESEEARKLGIEIVKHMNDMCNKFCQETGLNFGVIGTPAEGLAGRFVKMDRKRYGSIPGVTDRDYYTNSSHVPVYYTISIAEKISIESKMVEYEPAGNITYIEMDGDPSKNLDAFEKVIRMMKESGTQYGSVNFKLDSDPICGYHGIINNECPLCGRHEGEAISLEELQKKGIKTRWNPDKNGMVGKGVGYQRLRRITGYLVGSLERFNFAKKQEVLDRQVHGLVDLDKMLEEKIEENLDKTE